MLARCLLMGLIATTCLGALRGEQATATPDNKDPSTPPLDTAIFTKCTGHAECKPAAAEDGVVAPTFCAEVTGIPGGRCHPCSECHAGARATAATAVRAAEPLRPPPPPLTPSACFPPAHRPAPAPPAARPRRRRQEVPARVCRRQEVRAGACCPRGW